MIKARASGSKGYLYFMKKGRQVRHRIPQNSCFLKKCAKASHIFSTKNIREFEILEFEIFNETLTNDVVSFEQPGPVGLYPQNPSLS